MKTILFLFVTVPFAFGSAQTAFAQTATAQTATAQTATPAPSPTKTAGKKSSKKSTAPTATAAIVIPKSATLADDGFYHYTDSKGKKWLYRNTPFGVARAEEAPPAAPAPVEEDHLTKATVVGDTVKFERPNVFGVSKWEKKTIDLTDEEKKIVENQRVKQQ